MQKEKPTKVYQGNKAAAKKGTNGFFKVLSKRAKYVVAKAMAGSVQHIAILAACGVLTVAVVGGAVWGISSIVSGGNGGNIQEIEIDPEADNKYNKDENKLDADKYASTILQQSADAGQEYIDETLFIGDSNTVRSLMYDVTGTTWENVVGAVGLGIQHVASNPEACVKFTQPTTPVDIVTAVKWIQPKRVIFTFGTNNASWTVDRFIEEYEKAVEATYNAYPYFDVIINAIPPVDKIRDYPNVTMQQIDKFNAALAKMCEEKGYKFLNSAEVLKDDATGFAKKDYTISDGIHLSKNGFTALFEYIRTHAYETEDRRPELTYCPKRNETEMPSIIQDPTPIRGGLKVIFTSNDYDLGSVDGEVEQYVKYTRTSDAVTAVAKSGGIFTGWTCQYGGISDTNAATITYTAPQLDESITTVTITANFKRANMDISHKSLNLEIGQSATLTAKGPNGGSVTWSTSNAGVASVNSNGVVTANGAGTATITASSGGVSATCAVTVKPKATPTPEILKSISIKAANDAKEIKVGETLALSVVTDPENAVLGTVTWISDNAEVASVAANGATNVVTAKKEGVAIIKASVNEGKLTATYEVKVVSNKVEKPMNGITVSASPTTIKIGETTTVKATKTPADTTDNAAVEFESSNSAVATVDKTSGVVKGVTDGTTVIKAKCGSYSANITITVQKAQEAHTHTWVGATCTEPEKCSSCGETKGTALGHDWKDATCTAPKTCSRCSATEGEALGHTPGSAATCTTAQTCTICGAVIVPATGQHSGGTATCKAKAICSTCNQEYGEFGSHVFESGVCTICNTTEAQ